MKYEFQKRHIQALLKICGVRPGIDLSGFAHSPPSKYDRFRQELAFIPACIGVFTGSICLIISGREFKYVKGKIIIDFNPSISKIVGCVLRREVMVSLKRSEFVDSPLSTFIELLDLDSPENLKAIIGFNTSIVLFANSEGAPVVIHYATSEDAEVMLQRHFDGLSLAKSNIADNSLNTIVPTPICFIKNSRHTAVKQSFIAGVTPDLQRLSENEFSIRLATGLVPLHELFKKGNPVETGPDDAFISQHLLSIVQHLPVEQQKRVRLAIALLKNWQSRKTLPAVLIHGDYWMGNILFNDKTEIAGIVDWEWCRSDGLPLIDALQLAVMSAAVRKNESFSSLLCQLWLPEIRESWFEKYLISLTNLTQISRIDIGYIGVVLWLETIWRGYVVTSPEHPDWLDNMISSPSDAIKVWAETNDL